MIAGVFTIILFFILIILISHIIGNFINVYFKLDLKMFSSIIGYGVWISILFVFSQFAINDKTSSQELFVIFNLITLILIATGLFYIKLPKLSLDTLVIVAYILLMVIISTRYTMGEELGDNVFLINLVTKNIDADIVNNFNISTGIVYDSSAIGSSKEALTFYHFFAYIINLIESFNRRFNMTSLPYYLYYIWTASLTFYYLSIKLILGIYKYSESKSKYAKIFLITFTGLYIGTYYFNVNLAYYGITYLALLTAFVFVLMTKYINSGNRGLILVLFLIFLAMYSHGAIGLITSAYLLFGFIATLLVLRNRDTFLFASILLLPIVYYSRHLSNIIPITNLPTYLLLLSLLLFAIHSIPLLKSKSLGYGKLLLALAWILIIILNFKMIANYKDAIYVFFEPKENFDRVRDYFTFNTPFLIISNLFHYSVLGAYFFNKDKSRYGLIFLFILMFFMNPLVFPLLYNYFSFHYHRAYYSVFNIATLGFGLIILVERLEQNSRRYLFLLTIGIILIGMTVYNWMRYESILYIPGDNYNTFYKLEADEIEVLQVLQSKIRLENYENPKVISQIYGTQIFVPEVNQVYFNTRNRRAWDPNPNYEYDELYKIFYTPVFAGDDGPRFDANNQLTCSLLISKQIDFIIYDKNLSVFDEQSENWIPNHWYARACAELVYENDRYIMYRFFWK